MNIIIILLYRYNSYIYKNYNGRGVSKIMSSLQKFHRRTMSLGPMVTWPATAIGGGDNTHGYWLGPDGLGTSKLIVAPKSTETQLLWCPTGTPIVRGTTSTTDGLANTNTLAGFGQAAHPAAYYCKYLTTGGYNTWYMPAKEELLTMYSNKSATPFVTANGFNDVPPSFVYYSSTERTQYGAWSCYFTNGTLNGNYKDTGPSQNWIRAVRRSTI